MSLEPIPLDRKSSSLRERKQGSSESLGSVARWRGSPSPSHHNRRPHEFNRSGDFRRLAGHRRMGSWQQFPEEREHMFSRSCDKKLEEDNYRSSFSRGEGRYERGNKESRGTFSQREWRGRSSENVNNAPNMSRRQTGASNDRKSVDDMLTYSSRPNSDLVNTWEQHQMKDQHNKMDGVNRFGIGQRCDRDSSMGTVDWKPLKWTRPGSSRDSGFSRSSGMRSLGGTSLLGSCEGKVGLQQKFVTADKSYSREAATFRTSSAPSEETNSKKPRLNWGEGLAKFEKKQVEEVPEVTSNKDDPVSPPFNMESNNFLSPGLVDKSPKVLGVAGCASPTTLSSTPCSSSPAGADDKLFGKVANLDCDVENSGCSPGPGSQSHLQMFSFNLEKVDIDSLTRLGSSLAELLPQFDNLNSIDCSVLSSTTMNKLMLLKADISKLLEVTETEIDSLETELRSLKSKSEGRFSCSTAVGSLVCCNSKSCDKHVGASDKVAHFEPLQIVSSDDLVVEKTPFSSNLLDNPEPARSKFVEHLPMINAVSRCDVGRYGNCLEDLDGIQSTSVQCLVPCTYRHVANVSSCGNNSSLEVVSSCGDNNSSLEVKNGVDAKSSASFYSSTEDNLYDQIISCNKKIAKEASDVIAKLMPEKCRKNNNIGASSGSCSHDGTFIMEGFAKRRRSARLKERVVTLKFKALQHLWKEDSSLLSTRKHRPKSHKKIELDLRTTNNGHQKKRSSFRFPSPAANKLRLVPTSEMIKYTSQLLSESKHDIHRSTLKMPALILDQKEKMNSMFLSSNGLVEDPLAIEKERAMINPWTSEEKEVFLEKFAAFGKDFQKISTFLDHKTTADCVEFYYKNHKSDCFEKIKKKDDDKVGKFFNAKTDLIKWNSEANTSSLEVLRAASVTADGIALNRKMRSGRSLWRGYDNKTMSKGDKIIAEKPNSHAIIQEERETNAAADVLASICDDFHLPEAASSSITSSADPVKGKRVRKSVKARAICKQPPMPVMTQSIDPESCSDESCGEMELTDWTDVEKAAFLHALSSFGKDFAKIAQCVGTRSQFQCRAFFCKTHKRIGMDLMGERAGVVGSPGDDDVDGGRSDADNACIPETASANGSDTSGSKTVVDQPAYDKNLYQEESNPLVARNLSAESDESEEINGKADRKEVNIFSNAYMTGSESKLGTDCNAAVLYSFDGPATVQHQSAIVISDSTEILKDKPSEGGGAVTELVSDMGTIEPCCSNSAAEGRLVSDGSSGLQGNELEASTVCRVDSDEVVTDVVVELKDNVHNSRTSGNTSLSPVEASCSRLSADAENEPQLCLEKPQFSGLSEGPVTKLNMNMICSSSATELPLLPQKVEQQGAHKSLQCLPNSEDTPNVKIFGKVLTIPSSTQKPNSSAKRNEENGTHDNTGTESAKLKVYDNDFRGIDFNAPIMNSGHGSTVQPAFSPPLPDFNAPYMGCSHGNTIQSGFSSLPASSILLAKYPAAFGLNAQPFSAVHHNRNQLKDQLLLTPKESNASAIPLLEIIVLLIDLKLPWSCVIVGHFSQNNGFALLRQIILTGKDNAEKCIGSSLEHLLTGVMCHIGQKPCICSDIDPRYSFSLQILTIPFLWHVFPNLRQVFARQGMSQHYVHQMATFVPNLINFLPKDISDEFPTYACLLGNILEIGGVALSQPDCSFDMAINLAAVTTVLLEAHHSLTRSDNRENSMIAEDDITGNDEVMEVALDRKLDQQIYNSIDTRFLLQLTNILFRDISSANGPDDMEVAAVGAVCGFLYVVLNTLPIERIMTVLAYRTDLVPMLWKFMKRCQENKKWSSLSERLSYLSGDAPGWLLPLAVFCPVYKHMLMIVDNEEFYEQEKPLSLKDMSSLIILLKQALWQLLWVNHTSSANSVRSIPVRTSSKKLSIEAIQQRVSIVVSELLSQLQDWNNRRQFTSPSDFHADGVNDFFISQAVIENARANEILKQAAFLIPFTSRVKIFTSQLAAARQRNGSHAVFTRNRFRIRRDHILEDAYNSMSQLSEDDLRGLIRVTFVNEFGVEEAGIDGGGIFKDFMENITRASFDVQYGLFKETADHLLYPNPGSGMIHEQHLQFFHFLGTLLAKAMFEGILVDLPFATFFLSKLKQKHNYLNDLPSLDPELYRHLIFLKRYEGDISDLELYFVILNNEYGEQTEEELLPGGKNLRVTNENVITFIHLVANHRLNSQIRQQSSHFLRGFQQLIQKDWIDMFNEHELQLLISGSLDSLDVDDLREHTNYAGTYHSEHDVIEMFWEVLKGFSMENKKKFLKFVTGCSRGPLLGFRYLEPLFCIQRAGGNATEDALDRLPTAATCMNLLKLPPYRSKDQMESKLLYAINSDAGFDLS